MPAINLEATEPQAPERSVAARFLLALLNPKIGIPLLLLAMVLAVPLAMRGYYQFGIPVVDEPFDLQKSGTIVVPAGENSYDFYRVAARDLHPTPGSQDFIEKHGIAIAGTWNETAPELRNWLEKNRPALKAFLQGTERDGSMYYQPSEYTISTLLPVTQTFREFATLVHLEAARLEAERDWASSWKIQNGLLRASRHSGRNGCFIERLVGIAIYSKAMDTVIRWAEHPEVSRDQLQQALTDVQSARRMTPSLSEVMRTEYFITSNVIDDLGKSAEHRKQFSMSAVPGAPEESLMGMGGLLMSARGEPQISRRVARQVWANWLSQADKPRPERAKRGFIGLYVLLPSTSRPANLFSEEQVWPWVQRTSFLRQVVPAVEQVTNAHDKDIARQGLLETLLALQIYARDHGGAYPESLAELEPKYLQRVPTDPFGKGPPIQYRRESAPASGFTLWSIGSDEVDDGGKTDLGGGKGDEVLKFPRPKPAAAGLTSPSARK